MDMAQAANDLAAKLKADPNNGPGWLMYARTEAMLGNWQDSADAYTRAIALGQTDADVYAGYGEMLVLGTDGIVGPPARAAFASALQRDAKNDVARYYTALADAQAGEFAARDRGVAGAGRRHSGRFADAGCARPADRRCGQRGRHRGAAPAEGPARRRARRRRVGTGAGSDGGRGEHAAGGT